MKDGVVSPSIAVLFQCCFAMGEDVCEGAVGCFAQCAYSFFRDLPSFKIVRGGGAVYTELYCGLEECR